jgi:hypothetical protein
MIRVNKLREENTSIYQMTITVLLVISCALVAGGCKTFSPEATHTSIPSDTAQPTSIIVATKHPKITLRPSSEPSLTSTYTPLPINGTFPQPLWKYNAVLIDNLPQVLFVDWESESLVVVTGNDYVKYSVDAKNGAIEAISTPTPYPTLYYDPFSSETEDYILECTMNELVLYRKTNLELLGISNIPVQDCWSIDWAKDDMALSIVSTKGEVFIWEINCDEPYYVGEAIPASKAVWSPDSRKLVVSSLEGIDTLGEATYNIVFPDGRPQIKTGAILGLSVGWDWDLRLPLVYWYSDDVLTFRGPCGAGCIRTHYLDALSGEELTAYAEYWFILPKTHKEGDAIASHNNRWLVLDKQMLVLGNPYALYDFKTRQEYTWVDNPKVKIEFLDWSEDDSRFYFIRYPSLQETESAGDSVYGLMALNPINRQTELLIEKVGFATWNQEMSMVFAVTAEPLGAKGAYNLMGAIFTSSGEQLTPSHSIAEFLVYDLLSNDLIPVTWSNNGNRVVFSDASDTIWISDSNGNRFQVATGLPHDAWLEGIRFNWSPDDSFLLVCYSDQAWLVDLHGD